ncbi:MULTISPECIES: serine acetyltransferase [Edwardsiella]|nr:MULTISPECIES: serine acetyltransferase [Edwardsiella]AKM48182.1 serine acetyltransferase [Edwardsiella sp. EA181011]GAJ66600.1 serine acetyltransferase [Edwardsiella piscicida]AKR77424.1 serine acetyltransferase [Edwardsiella sp. LADL05-105]KAB0592650.1 serine acetyltransferase [Edwardsiella anguillarum]RFT04013.1 serine acetyltransferase [Edwardsiella anguillarum]
MKPHDHELSHLKRCLRREVMVSDQPFSWLKTLHKAFKCPERRFYFWWRIANYLHRSGTAKKTAVRISRNLRNKYCLDIKLGCEIGEGLRIAHYVGIVITGHCVIGNNLYIRQNVTIGVKQNDQAGKIYIGDNVEIGANCCIIGDDLHIGDNVTIGAMSFINKNIPSNHTVYTPKAENIIRVKKPA